MESVSGIGGQAINVNIEGAAAIDTAIVENGKRNMERLNGNFSEIASMMGISRSYVSRIETKAINKLAEVIKE